MVGEVCWRGNLRRDVSDKKYSAWEDGGNVAEGPRLREQKCDL